MLGLTEKHRKIHNGGVAVAEREPKAEPTDMGSRDDVEPPALLQFHFSVLFMICALTRLFSTKQSIHLVKNTTSPKYSYNLGKLTTPSAARLLLLPFPALLGGELFGLSGGLDARHAFHGFHRDVLHLAVGFLDLLREFEELG